MKIGIGALGGSGTRAIAQVFMEYGIYVGNDLNGPNDNLIFTRLFKNPEWFKNATEQDIRLRIEAFSQYMEQNALRLKHLRTLKNAAKSNTLHPSDGEFYKRLFKMLFYKKRHRKVWAWKEPNTQLFLPHLFNAIPDLKYIHVLRHGLDMAFSKNTQQLQNWGWLYNIPYTGKESETETAQLQLKYWIASTQAALEIKEQYPNQFLVLNHSEFCAHPKREMERVFTFCDLPLTETQLQKLSQIPQNTGSNNRYKQHDLHIFDSNDIQLVQDWGFSV